MTRTATAGRPTPIASRRRLLRRLATVCRAAGLPKPRQTPFTFWYLMVLAASTIVLRSVRPHTAHQLLAWSSTNVTELSQRPAEVLVASALWLPGVVWAPYAAAFTLVLAPVERVLGAGRTILVFASGHLVATLATQVPVAVLIGLGGLSPRWADVLDFGVSYGLLATVGVLLGMLARRPRGVGLLIAQAVMVGWLVIAPGVSSAGHLVALNVGVLWWPWLAGRGLTGVLRGWPRPVPAGMPAVAVAAPVTVPATVSATGSAAASSATGSATTGSATTGPATTGPATTGSATTAAATPAGTAGSRSATR